LVAGGGLGTAIGLQGVQFPHLEVQFGGVEPIRILLAPLLDDTKLSPTSLSTLSYDQVKVNHLIAKMSL